MANDLVPYSQALQDPATTAANLETTDVIAIAREDSNRPTGFKSMVTRLLTLAKKIVSGIDYSTELTETDAKTITGAINEVAQNSGSVDITTAINTPASVQTFNDGGDNIPLKSCLCNIPIDADGISSVTVSLAGKNLCPILSSQTVNGVQMVASSDGTLTFNRISASAVVSNFEIPILIPSGEYTISANNNMSFSGETLGNMFFRPYDANGTSISVVPFNAVNKTYTFTNSISKIVIRIASQFSETDFTLKMQLEQGDASTAYETYKGHNTTISLGETLTQGGTLEAVSGLLTRTDETTTQLTGVNIDTLSGLNNIYTDCGDIQSLEYFNENGNDIDSLANLETRLSGRIRTKTYTGDGSIPLVVTFDEVPTMILNIFGPGQGSQVICFPFVYGLTSFGGVYVTPNPWTSPTQAGGNHLLYKVAYSNGGKTMTVRASAGDAGAQFNQSGDTYTIYYLV